VSYRKGKTYREIYGVKRAKSERKKRDMHTRKGKTREEIFGKRIANKMKRALAKSHKGLPGWGKGLTKETSSIIKQRGIDISLWNKKYPKERIERTKKFMKASGIRPTKPEKKVISFIKQNRLPYKYVGDGDFWLTLGGIDINPDFINFKHKKEFIEVLGCYWHRCLKCRIANAYISAKVEKNVQRDRLKTKLLKKYGYKVIRIWEHEIKDGSFIKKIVGGSYGKNVTHRKRM
jgi:DNA mismatch endonuclease (patch repair protein)